LIADLPCGAVYRGCVAAPGNSKNEIYTLLNLKELKTAIQLGKLVRFLYHNITNFTKRGTSVAALG